jgi:hypothetical protein
MGGDFMFKRAREIKIGDTVQSLGQVFVVETIQILVVQRQVIFVDVTRGDMGHLHLTNI